MATEFRQQPRKPRKLAQTVYTDRGLRLPAVARLANAKWFWPAMVALPVCAFGLVFGAPSPSGLQTLFSGGGGGRYMAADNPWAKDSDAARHARDASVSYSGCDEVRAAGKAPLYAGEPGYREGLDRDLDGVACEPYRGF